MLSLTCASCGNSQEPPPEGSPVPTRCAACSGILIVSLEDPAARRKTPRPAVPGAAPPEPPPSPAEHPSPFGKYRLERRIGRGGMAVVYDARDTLLDRRVALKVMSQNKSDDPKRAMESWQRFMQEARLSANLPKHPNICTVYEAGVVEERHRFIAMEFVPGRSFADWRASPPKPLRDQVRVLRAVASAVHYAHEQGIVHRDLKPSNILVDDAGQPVVTDFGLAKSLAGGRAPSLTPSGFIVGSPAYMSPEQALGREEVDRRSDVYALGAILYEILTGRPSVEGKNPVEVLSKVVEGQLESPSARMKAVSMDPPDPALERVCMRAMRRKPEDRYATAQAFADELGRWLGEEGVRAPEKGVARRWVVASSALAALALAAAGYLAWERRSAEKEDEERRRVAAVKEAERLRLEEEARKTPPVVVDLKAFRALNDGYFRLTHYLHFGSPIRAEAAVAVTDAGEYDIVITAGCDPAKDEFAKFRVYVDGRGFGETSLTSQEPLEYRVRATLDPGLLRLAIEFSNDLWEPDKQLDRNLHVHGVVLRRVR